MSDVQIRMSDPPDVDRGPSRAGVAGRPSVAAAVVTYNHRDAVLRLLDFLDSRGIPTFVTENAGSDGTRDAIRGRFTHVSVLESPANLGGCGGFDCAVLAALSAGTDYILLVDDDALPVGDCVDQLARFLDEHDDHVFAAPVVYISSRPELLQEAGGCVDFSCENPVEAWHRFETAPTLPPHFDIDYASACCLMVRADAVMRLGVMDWNYFIFSDDVDWSIRLRRAFGKRAACVSTARVLHDFPWAKPFAPMRLYFFQRNGLYMQSRLREGEASAGVLHRSVRRLARSALYARLIGDREMARTSWGALRDAHAGRFGAWREPVAFPSPQRAALDAAWFRRHAIRRVLVDITIEDVDADIIRAVRSLAGDDVTIDVLCDGHRVQPYREKGIFADVHGRRSGLSGRLLDYRAMHGRRYDLTITDAAMEPRRPSSMSGRHAAMFHAGSLYAASAPGAWSWIAWLLAPVLAVPVARRLAPRLLVPPRAGLPPPEAREVLARIGVSPEVGQPWARDWTAPFPSPRAGDAAVLRVPAPHVDPVEPGWTPLHRSVAASASDPAAAYDAWCAARRRTAATRYGDVRPGPRFSVIVRATDRSDGLLAACLASVAAQTYDGWEAIVVGGAASMDAAGRMVSLPAEPDEGPTEMWNRGAGAASGDYLLFVDACDALDAYALAAFAQASDDGRAALLYADEDRIDGAGRQHAPEFKPAFSPAKLAAVPYVGRPVAIRRDVFAQVGGFRDGGEHDLLLRVVESGATPVHVADVLYHRRVAAGGPSSGVQASIEPPAPRAAAVAVESPARVSVLVRCEGPGRVEDVRAAWAGCECLVTPDDQGPPAQRLTALARQAGGDVLVFASSELRPMAGWRRALEAQLSRPDAGLVAGALRYHDGRLHSAGLALGIAGAVGRWQHGQPAGDPGYGAWIASPHEVSAVPWQFLAVRRDVFLADGGFDAAFAERGWDVDLALRLTERGGVRHVYLPDTGGRFLASYPEEALEAWRLDDLVLLWERWGAVIRRGDPYLNRNLSLLGEEARLVSQAESELRERGGLMAWDRPTVQRLAGRFPGRLRAPEVAGADRVLATAGA